jgi:hypothetical protein
MIKTELTWSNSVVFQAGGLVVVLVEVNRKPYLASIVPVIVNAILNEHQIIVDIVAFVSKGDFPRSRLGEKQRGKLLAGWVSRKLRTLAQFAIRDVDPAEMGGSGGQNANRVSMMSTHSGGNLGNTTSSFTNVEPAPQILEQEEVDHQLDDMAAIDPITPRIGPDDGQTPTGYPPGAESLVSPLGTMNIDDQFRGPGQAFTTPDFGQPGPPSQSTPQAEQKPGSRAGEGQAPPQIRLPGVDGREMMDFWSDDKKDEGQSWEADAIMHMNLMGSMNPPK